MKTKFFLLAAAAVALASCSNDEVVEVNQGEAISFRSLVNGQTRAADVTTTNISSFNVEAFNTGTTSSPYFSNIQFTKQGDGTFTSTNKYYWPSVKLDFYAYSPITEDVSSVQKGANDGSIYQIVKSDYKTFTITPSSTVASQVDFVYANLNNQGKETTNGVAGAVPLNFRHTGSKIVLKVLNTEPNLKIDVTGWKVANVDGEAVFTYADVNTVTENDNENVSGTTLAYGDWSGNDNNYTASYKGEFTTANVIPASESTAKFLNSSSSSTASETTDEALNMILIPQTHGKATKYSGTAENLTSEGSYIAVKMVIKNNDNNTVIYDATTDGAWAIWPVEIDWAPGKKYTYTIDLSQGGYYEKNTNDGDDDLDPILEGAVIKFVSVTVDDWDNNNETLEIPSYNLYAGTNYTFNEANSTTPTTYTYSIGGFTLNYYYKVIKGGTNSDQITSTTPNNDTATQIENADGTISVTAVVAANSGTPKTSTLTISEYSNAACTGDPVKVTVITINQTAE